jgi:hypothetical protein
MKFHQNPFESVRQEIAESVLGEEKRSEGESHERDWVDTAKRHHEQRSTYEKDKKRYDEYRKERAAKLRKEHPDLAAGLTKQVRESLERLQHDHITETVFQREGESMSDFMKRWDEDNKKRKERRAQFDAAKEAARKRSESPEEHPKHNKQIRRDKIAAANAIIKDLQREEYIMESIEALKQKIKQGRASAADYAEYAKLSKSRKEQESGSEDIKKRVERAKEERRSLAGKERERETRERGESLLHDIQAREKAREDRENRQYEPEKREPKKEAPASTVRKLPRGAREDKLASRANAVIRQLQKEGYLSDWRGEMFNEEHPYVEVMPEYGKGKKSGEVKSKKETKENK